MAQLLSFLYILAVSLLSIYGLLGFFTLILYLRHRKDIESCPKVNSSQLPKVTIQLPVYNERFVIRRLITAAANLEYPLDRLQIQVIDDSNDDTIIIAQKLIEVYQSRGVNIQHICRSNRRGYKAGALSEAMPYATGDYIAIFDADFVPSKDFLLKAVPHLLSDSNLGMIQARWGHLNDQDSSLTSAQSIALDKHFIMEQYVRHRANLFPKFNGAAGIWRRDCIEDAGGWQDDTVCEDLCLSTRAVLKGWRFRFLPDVVAPAELPTDILAYKNQQARWAKGSIQCLHKYSGAIIKEQQYTIAARLYALLSMSAYATHVLLLLIVLLQIPLLLLDVRFSPLMFIFTIIGLGQPLLFILAQKESYSDWKKRLLHFPTLLLVAIGTAPSNTKAMIQALFAKEHIFVRTPKGFSNNTDGIKKNTMYQLPFDSVILVEAVLFIYSVVGIILSVSNKNMGSLSLLMTIALGFGYILFLEFKDFFVYPHRKFFSPLS